MMLSVFTELRRVDGDSAELVAVGYGVVVVRQAAFGPSIIVVRDGREHELQLATARALFGESAVLALLDCAEIES